MSSRPLRVYKRSAAVRGCEMDRLLAALIGVTLLAGCSTTVSGTGHQVSGVGSATPGEPAESSSTTAPPSTGSAAPSPTVSSSTAQVDLDKLRVGDCIEPAPPESVPVESLPVVSCRQPHDQEVTASRDLGPGAWPGHNAIDARSARICSTEFETYVGIPVDQSRYDIYWYRPGKEAWQNGDHLLLCLVFDQRGKTTGTLRATRR